MTTMLFQFTVDRIDHQSLYFKKFGIPKSLHDKKCVGLVVHVEFQTWHEAPYYRAVVAWSFSLSPYKNYYFPLFFIFQFHIPASNCMRRVWQQEKQHTAQFCDKLSHETYYFCRTYLLAFHQQNRSTCKTFYRLAGQLTFTMVDFIWLILIYLSVDQLNASFDFQAGRQQIRGKEFKTLIFNVRFVIYDIVSFSHNNRFINFSTRFCLT